MHHLCAAVRHDVDGCMSHAMLLGAWHVSPSPLSNRRSGSCAWSSSVSSGSSEAVRLGAPLHRQWALRLSPCRGLRGLVRYWEIKIPFIHGPGALPASTMDHESAHPEHCAQHRGPTWSAPPAQRAPTPIRRPPPASGCDRPICCRGNSDTGKPLKGSSDRDAGGSGADVRPGLFLGRDPGPPACQWDPLATWANV